MSELPSEPWGSRTLVRILVLVLVGTLALSAPAVASPGAANAAAISAVASVSLSDRTLPRGTAPAHWTDVGVLGYFDPGLNRRLTYADLKTDLQPLIDAEVLRHSGDTFEVLQEGAEIIGYDFPLGTNIRISAANVTIKRSRIRAGHSTKHRGAIYFQYAAPGTAQDGSQSTVVLEDNEISGGKFGIYPSFDGVRLLARRNAVLANSIDPSTGRPTTADLDMADGIDWRGTYKDIGNEPMASIIEQNWVGGFVNGGAGHHYDGIVIVSGGNLKVLNNRIEAYGVTQTVGVRVVSDIAPVRNVWVEGNSIAGFGYSFGFGWGNPTHTPTGEVTNLYFRNNVSEAGSYQSGPLTVSHVDEDSGSQAVFNFVREGNICEPVGSREDLHERWQSLSTEELLLQCDERFGNAHVPRPDSPDPDGPPLGVLPDAQAIIGFCPGLSSIYPFVADGPTIFRPFIDCLLQSGITQGTSASTYSPNHRVTRGQMASFIARELDQAVGLATGTQLHQLPVHDGRNQFGDVPHRDVHLASINRLAQVGIVQGGVAGQGVSAFGPELFVTRGQMASFLNRAHGFLTGSALSTSSDFFTDDDEDVHEGNINGIAARGIAVGDGVASFGLTAYVTRAQMAAFIVRHLAVLESDGRISPLPHL